MQPDWNYVAERMTAIPGNRALPRNFASAWLSRLYQNTVHAFVLAWLDEVQVQTLLLSGEVSVVEKRFSGLYVQNPDGFFQRVRQITVE